MARIIRNWIRGTDSSADRLESRNRSLNALLRQSANAPPKRFLLLDHVSKTGGSTVIEALKYIFPLHTVAERIDVSGKAASGASLQDVARWPIVCGHIGRRSHHLIPDLDRRVKCTIIREPVSRSRSVYTFFRFNVRPQHPSYDRPELAAARELSFSEFIRQDAVRSRISNQQSHFLSSDPDSQNESSAAEQAARTLSVFDVVGVTDQMATFFDRLLDVMDVQIPTSSETLLQRSYRRKSQGSVTMSEEDIQWLRSINSLDLALYDQAKRRSMPADRAA